MSHRPWNLTRVSDAVDAVADDHDNYSRDDLETAVRDEQKETAVRGEQKSRSVEDMDVVPEIGYEDP